MTFRHVIAGPVGWTLTAVWLMAAPGAWGQDHDLVRSLGASDLPASVRSPTRAKFLLRARFVA